MISTSNQEGAWRWDLHTMGVKVTWLDGRLPRFVLITRRGVNCSARFDSVHFGVDFGLLIAVLGFSKMQK